jgi:hypothetical protein
METKESSKKRFYAPEKGSAAFWKELMGLF